MNVFTSNIPTVISKLADLLSKWDTTHITRFRSGDIITIIPGNNVPSSESNTHGVQCWYLTEM